MASSSRGRDSGVTRKLVWLAVVMVLAIVAYSGAWFYAADRLKSDLDRRMAASREGMFSMSCRDLAVRGFPFRIGVFCGAVELDDRPSGTSATFGALRSAAQVYRPGHAIVELDGPAEIRVTPDTVINADWSLLHASAVGWTDGLDRFSLAYDELKGRLRIPSAGAAAGFTARHGEVHLRRAGTALDVATSANELTADFGDSTSPPIDAMLDATIADAAGWVSPAGPPDDALLGAKVELRRLALELGDGQVLTLSGPLAVDDEGYLSGRLDLDVQGISVWRERISELFPDAREVVVRVAQAVKGLSGGGETARVKLDVRDGTVYLGFFPIAIIPPL